METGKQATDQRPRRGVITMITVLMVQAMFLTASGGVAQTDSATDEAPGNSLYWVFLVTGKSTEGVERDEIKKMQAAHLDNFRKLAEAERLLTAGPLSDPEGQLRGIVIVRAPNIDEVNAMFQDDPYVQQGFMKMVAVPMQFELGEIRTQHNPSGMEEFRLSVLEAAPDQVELTPALENETRAFLKQEFADGKLLLSVRLNDRIHMYRQVLVFSTADTDDELTAQIGQVPAMKAGAWTHRLMPLYMGRGAIVRDQQ